MMAPAIPMADLPPFGAPGTEASGDNAGNPANSSAFRGSATTLAVNPTSVDRTSRTSAGSSGSASQPPLKPKGPTLTELDLLRAKFRDFDDGDVYNDVKAECQKEEALNFVVQFGVEEAKVACNLDHKDFENLMAERNVFDQGQLPVRWINIWNPSRQRNTIKTIGKHYNFSKRLILSIWAWDEVKQRLKLQKHAAATAASSAKESAQSRGLRSRGGARLDLESGENKQPAAMASSVAVSCADSGPEDDSDLAGIFDPRNMATFAMMQRTIDYTSIDLGSRFICFGANWLHEPPGRSKTTLVPPKHWSWFALCDDNTIISFHESYYESFSKKEGEENPHWRDEELKSTRDNTLKVFRQLSTQGQDEDKHKIMQLTSVRESMSMVSGQEGKEGACNIFYYLFEDYSGAMFILGNTKAALDNISKRILRTAEWRHKENTADIIPKLYKLNKELRQLRHLFTNYHTLISKIINKDLDEAADTVAPARPVVALLSYSAMNRFKRLQVQLQSLMLDTIKDYLDEKESLQGTYFNLTNQKDSQATERLTRSATVLAKLSVFFLPISFMTSYFSVQIPELTSGYTKWSYWASFAVIAGVSFISIFFFSKVLMFLSDRLDRFADKVEGVFKRNTRWKQAENEIEDE